MGEEKNRRPVASATVISIIATNPAALTAPSALKRKEVRSSKMRAAVLIVDNSITLSLKTPAGIQLHQLMSSGMHIPGWHTLSLKVG